MVVNLFADKIFDLRYLLSTDYYCISIKEQLRLKSQSCQNFCYVNYFSSFFLWKRILSTGKYRKN